MTIEVTREHIERGIPGDSCNCPIALAMRDAGIEEPSASCLQIMGKYKGQEFYAVPEQFVRVFMYGFDNGFVLPELVFDLEMNEVSA